MKTEKQNPVVDPAAYELIAYIKEQTKQPHNFTDVQKQYLSGYLRTTTTVHSMPKPASSQTNLGKAVM